ncbi:hypothetical protein QM012_008877 [Aureobasidium pullulans]|uniref:Uncharacterized protein n=1 Tax=Aureobasidium pullulans TaxID=5580 RepID=A0ABR0TIQ7_AURPU
MHELEHLRAENHELKRRLSRLEDRHNREVNAAKRCEERILRLEDLSRTNDVEVESKFKHNSEIWAITCKEVKELKQHPALRPHPPVPCPPAASDTGLIKVEARLKTVEQQVQVLGEEDRGKNTVFAEEIDKLRSGLHCLHVELNKMQDKNEDENHQNPGLTEEELKNSIAWKDLQSRVENVALNVGDLSANTARIEDLTLATKSELEISMNEVKQMTSHSVPEAIRPQLEYISKTIENHIDLLQRHEFRLNSVTTDELYKMMENQWRLAYGVPAELRGLLQRQTKLETLTRGRCDDLNKRISEMNMKYEGMVMDFNNRELHLF